MRCRGHERLAVARRWSAVDTPEMALAVALTCLDPIRLEIAIESALHERLVSPRMFRELLTQAPARAKQTAALATVLSGSGVETLLKRALRDARIPFQQQVRLGRYRVDFLVCDWLVIEVDGRAFHDTPRMWAEDAERDFHLAEQGFRVQRFTFHQVRTRMDQCIALVTAILATAPTFVARHSAH